MKFMNRLKSLLAPLSLEKSVDLFTSSIYGVRSDMTFDWYSSLLGGMCDYFGADKSIYDISLVELREWRKSLFDRDFKYANGRRPKIAGHLSPFTIYGTVKVAKIFFKWLVEEKYLDESPAERLELPAKPKSTRTGIAEADMEKILTVARRNLRDLAIVLILRDTGCRRAGLAHLLLSDLNLDSADPRIRYRIKVLEKGKSSRIVFLADRSYKALRMWLDVRPNYAKPKCPFVFVGLRAATKGEGIAPATITDIIDRLADAAGVTESYTPHQWRHAFSRRLIAGKANLGQVSQVLGHSSVNTTMEYYGHLTVDQLQDTVDQCRPTDKPDFEYDD